jgi:hypothetical protein
VALAPCAKVEHARRNDGQTCDWEGTSRFPATAGALLARLLDVSLRTVSGLESGSVAPAQLRRNLVQANRLCGALAQAMESTFVGRWLDEPNEMLAGLKPVEAVERGQIDLVWQVVEGLRSGSQL